MALYEGTPYFYCEFCRTKYIIRTNYENEFFNSNYGVNDDFLQSGEKHYPLSTSCPECKKKMEGYLPQREF